MKTISKPNHIHDHLFVMLLQISAISGITFLGISSGSENVTLAAIGASTMIAGAREYVMKKQQDVMNGN